MIAHNPPHAHRAAVRVPYFWCPFESDSERRGARSTVRTILGGGNSIGIEHRHETRRVVGDPVGFAWKGTTASTEDTHRTEGISASSFANC
jgi:hypothetical protein